MNTLSFDGKHSITLAPGQLYFGHSSDVIHTLLGSCVAMTFWHSERLIGGMSHYLLAHRENYQKNAHHPQGYYGTDAVAYFIDQIKKSKLKPEDFEVKLFGGGNMFEATHCQPNSMDIASNNIEQGRLMLHQYGFKVKTADVGGVRYRKIYFELASGDVWVKYGCHSKTESVE
jgi:chemotaxis protein CheD